MAIAEQTAPETSATYILEPDRAQVLIERLRRAVGKADARAAQGIRVGAQEVSGVGDRPMRRVFVQTDTPLLIGGYVLVGKLEHKASELTRVRAISGRDLESWRGAEARCEHCQTRRPRRETFLLEGPDRRLVQVGRNCLKDYAATDADSSTLAILRAELLVRLDAILQSEARRGGPSTTKLELKRFVEVAAEVEMEHGYVSATDARASGELSTSQRVLAALRDGEPIPVRTAAQSLATRALAWIRELGEPDGEFLLRLSQACSAETISARQAGLVCALLVAYRERAVTRVETNDTPAPPDHAQAFGACLESLGCVSDLCGQLQYAWAGDELPHALFAAKLDLAVMSLLDVATAERIRVGDLVRQRLANGEAA